MKALYAILLAGLCLVVAAATFVLVAGPSDLVRTQVVDSFKRRTGRDLVIGGGTSFTFVPSLGIALGDVIVSQPAGMGDAPFATIARLEVATSLGAMLRRDLEVGDIVLKGAVIDLRETADGRRNWDVPTSPAGTSPRRRAELPSRKTAFAPFQVASAGADLPTPSPAADGAVADIVGLANVQLSNGTVRYHNERSGQREHVSAIELKARLSQPGTGLTFEGQGIWRGQPVTATGNVRSLDGLRDSSSPAAFKISAPPGEVQIEGTAALGPVPAFDGRVRASAGSLRSMAEWAGVPVPHGRGLGAFALAAIMSSKSSSVTLKEIVGSLDGVSAKGELALRAQDARPSIKGSLAMDRLDLNTHLGLVSTAPQQRSARKGQAPDAGAIGGLIEKLEAPDNIGAAQTTPAQGHSKSGPRVQGWSSVPLDLAALHAADLDLKLDLGQLVYKDMQLDKSRVLVSLQAGILKASFLEAALYRGRGTGTLDVDAVRNPPTVALQATFEGVDMLGLLKGAAQFDRMGGRGTVVVKAVGQGVNQQQITESLTGTAAVNVVNGAIVGFDVTGALRAAQKGQLPQASPTDKTEFNDLSGTFAIQGGVAQTQDLKLASPAVRVTGSGTIDLGKQALDLTLKPKLTAQAIQGGQGQIAQVVAGLDVPVHVKGPWDQPRASVDINGVLKDPDKIKKGVEQLGEILKSKEGREAAKEIGNAVRNLLGR